MATVRKYVDDFNQGDVEAMAADFARPASILDGLAPHLWQGASANQDWYRDVLAAGKPEGASDYFVTLDEPRHVDVAGDSAYVDVSATSASEYAASRLRKPARSLRSRWAASLPAIRRKLASCRLGPLAGSFCPEDHFTASELPQWQFRHFIALSHAFCRVSLRRKVLAAQHVTTRRRKTLLP